MKISPIDSKEIQRLGGSYEIEVELFWDIELFFEYRYELNNRLNDFNLSNIFYSRGVYNGV